MRVQWSLSVQLIGYSILILVATFFASRIHRNVARQRLKADLMNLGALVFFHENERGNFVVALDTFDTEFIDAITKVPNLERLHLSSTRITDEQLKTLCRMDLPDLIHLSLSNTEITNDGLAEIENLRGLKYLNLSDTSIGDSGVSKLGNLKYLVELDIQNTRFTNRGKRELKMILPNLRLIEGMPTESGAKPNTAIQEPSDQFKWGQRRS